MPAKLSLFGLFCLLSALPLAAEKIDFCAEPASAQEVVERTITFDLARTVFTRFGEQPAVIAHGAIVDVRFPLRVEGGQPSALRYTGSPRPQGATPSTCPTPVEEAPDCDGAGNPVYDVWIVNRDQLGPECLRSIDLRKLLCIRTLDTGATVIQVDNQQPCSRPVRVGLLLTVKSTQVVEVLGQKYKRQFQTPDPSLILEPP